MTAPGRGGEQAIERERQEMEAEDARVADRRLAGWKRRERA